MRMQNGNIVVFFGCISVSCEYGERWKRCVSLGYIVWKCLYLTFLSIGFINIDVMKSASGVCLMCGGHLLIFLLGIFSVIGCLHLGFFFLLFLFLRWLFGRHSYGLLLHFYVLLRILIGYPIRRLFCVHKCVFLSL